MKKEVLLWNTLIRGHANLGPCQEAIVLYRDVHRIGLLSDRHTFPFVLRSCAVLSALREGREVHCNIVKSGFNLDMFVQSFLVTITMPVDGYAIQLFHRMKIEKVEFDYITIVSVISACANLGALYTGKWVHELVRSKGLETNVSIKVLNLGIGRSVSVSGRIGDTSRESGVAVVNFLNFFGVSADTVRTIEKGSRPYHFNGSGEAEPSFDLAHLKARIDEAEADLNHANLPRLLEILPLGG
ncbi:hypothetical protein RHMOL_Rhmol09G0188600 [Rhododendron molle]|uniref:Uncharacterized protein n=1 Tax=Rhododendron molle TaxID=49168 RepID=A0ACC0MFI1_RHOML|nr:hypothetical protein RHMOL_Rhmol09G0188600 [Rhododendron molle]